MDNTIEQTEISEYLHNKLKGISSEYIPEGVRPLYGEVWAWFKLSTPKMKMEVIQASELWKGSITDVSIEEDQPVIIEVTTAPGKVEKNCWDALFYAGIDEIIRRQ